MDKLIVIPLMVLLGFSFFNMFYSGSVGGFGGVQRVDTLQEASTILYDRNSHAVCYANGTAVSGGEAGRLSTYTGVDGHTYYGWVDNGTFGASFQLSTSALPQMGLTWVVTGSLGMLGIIAGVMVLATLVGIRVLGIGISEMSISTLVKGTAFMSIFLLATAMSYSALISIPYFGWVLYFALTAMFTVGLIGQMGHAGGGD